MSTTSPHHESKEPTCGFCACGKTWLGALPESGTTYRVEKREAAERGEPICRVVAALRAAAGISIEELAYDRFIFLDLGVVNQFVHEVGQYFADLHIYPLTDPEISIYQIWQDMEQAVSNAEKARRDVSPKDAENRGASGEIHTTLLNFFLPDGAFYASYLVHSYCPSSDVNAHMRAAIGEFLASDAGKLELREGESFTWHDALEQVPASVFARHGIVCIHHSQTSIEANWDENLDAE